MTTNTYPTNADLTAMRRSIEYATPGNQRPGWPDASVAWAHETRDGMGARGFDAGDRYIQAVKGGRAYTTNLAHAFDPYGAGGIRSVDDLDARWDEAVEWDWSQSFGPYNQARRGTRQASRLLPRRSHTIVAYRRWLEMWRAGDHADVLNRTCIECGLQFFEKQRDWCGSAVCAGCHLAEDMADTIESVACTVCGEPLAQASHVRGCPTKCHATIVSAVVGGSELLVCAQPKGHTDAHGLRLPTGEVMEWTDTPDGRGFDQVDIAPENVTVVARYGA